MQFKIKGFFLKCGVGESGAVAVYSAIILTVLLGVAALAVDIGHLYGVKNELHNAADAGALAGAQNLFDTGGNLTIKTAMDAAIAVAEQNKSGTATLVKGTNLEVQVGHWSFAHPASTFTSRTSSLQPDYTIQQAIWQDKSFAYLDDPKNGFINAVKVVSTRPDTPSFLAKIFNFSQFRVRAEAVAYIGFAGSVPPQSVTMPFAICQQFLKDGDHYSCSTGRALSNTSETGGWTNFDQGCSSSNANDLKNLLCSTGNSQALVFNKVVSTTNGTDQSVFKKFYEECWSIGKAQGGRYIPPTVPMNMTIPVVDCRSGSYSQTCVEKIIGVVNVDIIWVQDQQKDAAPREMQKPDGTKWTCSSSNDDNACWQSFVTAFGLRNATGTGAPLLMDKTIYFLPNCKVHKPTGVSGGENYGILAKIPVLVH